MKKIIIDYLYTNYFSARSKAREDVNLIAQQCGYEMLYLKTRTTTEEFATKKNIWKRIFHNFKKLYILLLAIFSIPKKSEVLLQYPILPFGVFFTFLFCFCLSLKNCKLVILVHDIAGYGKNNVSSPLEVKTFNCADKLIIHTKAMENLFRQMKINTQVQLLYLFDYLTDETPLESSKSKYRVAFAGALFKSTFLNKLTSLSFQQVEFFLYGTYNENLNLSNTIHYEGRFSPENIRFIRADWGLVWDGDSIDNCNGVLGEYLKINSPHKTSLYIAAGIPVIIWEEAALAPFIQENNLGFTIKSISEIEEKIISFSPTELMKIRERVTLFSSKLRQGEFLQSLLTN